MIFEAISAKDHVNCSELVAMRGVTPATVSHHLRVLTEAGLVECKREGQFVCSRICLASASSDLHEGPEPDGSRLGGRAPKKGRREAPSCRVFDYRPFSFYSPSGVLGAPIACCMRRSQPKSFAYNRLRFASI